MFEQAKLKRECMNTRLNNFFKFKEGNATVTAGLLNNSAEKRKKIEDNLNRWSNPYAQTGFELARNVVDLSMSFRFSESNFRHPAERHEQNRDESLLRNELERQFYEAEPIEPKKAEEPAETLKPQPSSPVQERYNPSEQQEFEQEAPTKQQPSLGENEPVLSVIPPTAQPPASLAMTIQPDQLETERQGASLGHERTPNADNDDKVDVNNYNSMSLGESAFNYLDLSASRKRDDDNLAKTIKPEAPPYPADTLAVSQTQEQHPQLNESPSKSPQNSGVKEGSSGLNNNSSQGIFFTDDFKDYIDRKHPESQQQVSSMQAVVPELKPVQEEEWIGGTNTRKEMSPPPRQSLFTDPNEQLHLRESLTLSIFDKVFAEKISTQLVVDLEDVTLNKFQKEIARRKLAEIVDRYAERATQAEMGSRVLQLSQVKRFVKLQRRVYQSSMYEYFLHFKLYRQYRQNKLRRQIALRVYCENKTRRRVEKIFRTLRDITKAHKRWLTEFRKQSEVNLLFTAMKHWKMYWFHRRIKNEVKQFRISTLLSGWKRVADAQRKQNGRIALRFYYRKALERGFELFQQAVKNSQLERHNLHKAQSFCYQRQLRVVFEAWREVAEQLADQKRGRDFVPIEVTVKNKLTAGNQQLLRTREVEVNVMK